MKRRRHSRVELRDGTVLLASYHTRSSLIECLLEEWALVRQDIKIIELISVDDYGSEISSVELFEAPDRVVDCLAFGKEITSTPFSRGMTVRL